MTDFCDPGLEPSKGDGTMGLKRLHEVLLVQIQIHVLLMYSSIRVHSKVLWYVFQPTITQTYTTTHERHENNDKSNDKLLTTFMNHFRVMIFYMF